MPAGRSRSPRRPSRASAVRRTARSATPASSVEPLGRRAVQPQLAQPPRAVLGGQRMHGLRVVGEVDPEQGDPLVLAGDHHRGGRRGEVGHRPLHPGQPPPVHVVVGPAGHRGLRLAQRPGRVVGPGQRRRLRRRGADRGAGQRDRAEPRRRQQRVAGLLGQDGVLEQAEVGVEPAELGQLLPHPGIPAVAVGERDHPVDRVAVGQPVAGRRPQHLLLLGEGEVHCGRSCSDGQRDRGRPSTRSAMMPRRISEVPASMVFPRLRSCWYCQ